MAAQTMISSFLKTLSTYKRIGIDSMCFIYQFEGNRMYGKLVRQLFLLLQARKLTSVTSVLTLAEILAFERLQKDRALFEQTKAKLLTVPSLHIIPVDEVICETAAILKYQYALALPDALQLATALLSKLEAFVSNDRRLHKVKEIPVLLLNDFLPSYVL